MKPRKPKKLQILDKFRQIPDFDREVDKLAWELFPALLAQALTQLKKPTRAQIHDATETAFRLAFHWREEVKKP